MPSVVTEAGDHTYTISVNHLQDGSVMLSMIDLTWNHQVTVQVRLNIQQAKELGIVWQEGG